VSLREVFPLEQGHQREVPPKKEVILLLLALIVWKRLQIGTGMLLIIKISLESLVMGFFDLSTLMTLKDLEPSKYGF